MRELPQEPSRLPVPWDGSPGGEASAVNRAWTREGNRVRDIYRRTPGRARRPRPEGEPTHYPLIYRRSAAPPRGTGEFCNAGHTFFWDGHRRAMFRGFVIPAVSAPTKHPNPAALPRMLAPSSPPGRFSGLRGHGSAPGRGHGRRTVSETYPRTQFQQQSFPTDSHARARARRRKSQVTRIDTRRHA